MSDVAMARDLASRLIRWETRGPGDTDNAMRRIERKYGVPYRLQWSLRYRVPKDLMLSGWRKLLAAYEAECRRQTDLLSLEIERARALGNAVNPTDLAAAEAVVADEKGRRA